MPGDPHSGSKGWKAPDREIGKPRENRGKIIAHWQFQPAAAFHDRENRRNLRSRLWTADVRGHGVLEHTCDRRFPCVPWHDLAAPSRRTVFLHEPNKPTGRRIGVAGSSPSSPGTVTQDDLALRIAGLRPGEPPFLQPLGTDPQSATVPDKDLQPIALGVAE